jgi:hypothetical protein
VSAEVTDAELRRSKLVPPRPERGLHENHPRMDPCTSTGTIRGYVVPCEPHEANAIK